MLPAVVAVGGMTSEGGLLYFTDFEGFTPGAGNWVGTDGWQGAGAGPTGPGEPAPQGIDDKIVPLVGQTAYLGAEPPTGTFVSVFRNMNHDPVASGTDRIHFEALVGIEDSTNGKRDSFFCAFYNTSGEFLAGIRFSNELATFGIWRLNGLSDIDTTLAFIPGELHVLFADIDLQSNRWSADLDAIPLFRNVVFNATGKQRSLGPVAAEWQLAAADPADYGNNWMLVADWSLWAIPFGATEFQVDTLGWSASGEPMLTFAGEVGWDYQVEYSDDMTHWLDDLPGSFFTGLDAPEQLSFKDPTTGRLLVGRYYRVVRRVTP